MNKKELQSRNNHRKALQFFMTQNLVLNRFREEFTLLKILILNLTKTFKIPKDLRYHLLIIRNILNLTLEQEYSSLEPNKCNS